MSEYKFILTVNHEGLTEVRYRTDEDEHWQTFTIGHKICTDELTRDLLSYCIGISERKTKSAV